MEKMNIHYPQSLHKIFLKLIEHDIKPIIVGGYIRDTLMRKESHDIDIELYNISSLEDIEKLLKEFGSINSVGKSFGISKLCYKGIELDFSLPRRDSKIASGHQGFHIEVDSSLTFQEASSRRDFTINAMGYDTQTKKFLDPFNGKKDLHERRLKAVDIKKFGEDPLRILRAIMFHSRFEFQLDNTLFQKCKSMIESNILQELPQERIFEEIKKILLQSQKPSKGFLLLQKLGGFHFFTEFSHLTATQFKEILQRLDSCSKEDIADQEQTLAILLALLSSHFTAKERESFFQRITQSKKLLTTIEKLLQTKFTLEKYDTYSIYKLATEVDIELFTHYLQALYCNRKNREIALFKERAKELGVLHKPIKPLLRGKELLKFGLTPSPLFSQILKEGYEAQIRGVFQEKEEALQWVQELTREQF